MGRPNSKIAPVRVSGPLAVYAEGFHAVLADLGYTPLSAVTQMRLLGYLSRQLAAERLTAVDLDSRRIDQFLATRRAQGTRFALTRRALAPLLGHLADQGALPDQRRPPAPPPTGAEALVAAFERYLLGERGLTVEVAHAYRRRAGRLLATCAPEGRLAQLTPGHVSATLVSECATMSVVSAQHLAVALRAFLRFCHLEGHLDSDLSAAALGATGRRRSLLPQAISPAETRALLGSCDRRRAIGRRDHAVIALLVRLGLRAGEVAALRLEDLDWRAGEVLVRGKGSRHERLPLPVDVGEAIASYLRRGRPRSARRELFLSAVAPVAGLGRGAISSIVRRACTRAGLAPVGAHRLRHTMACRMLEAGAALAEIGQVLRHRDLTSTAIYARVDLERLRALAQPWPEGAGR